MSFSVIKKIVSTLTILALLIPAPQAFEAFFKPKKADAALNIAAGVLMVPVGDIPQTIKEFFLDKLAWIAAKQIIRTITSSIVDWINSDFAGGGPSFAKNPGQLFGKVADQIAGDLITSIINEEFICRPFRFNIALNISLEYSRRFGDERRCTLSDIVDNLDSFLDGNFSEGGWAGWFQLTQTNDPNSEYLDLRAQLSMQIGNQTFDLNRELGWGSGFLGFKRCTKFENDAVRPPFVGQNTQENGGRGKCIQQETATPGKVIEGQLQNALGSDLRQLELADEIDEIIGALAGFVLKKAFGAVGLFGFSSDDAGYKEYQNQINDIQYPDYEITDPGFGGGTGGGSCSAPVVTNFARGRSSATKMSSQYDGDQGGPGAAVDGNTNSSGSATGAGVAITGQDEFAWWQVDLGQSETIDEVRVFPRPGASSPVQNYHVIVSKQPLPNGAYNTATPTDGVTVVRFANSSVIPHTITVNADGRYIRIQRDNAGSPAYLELVEVEVYGTPKLDPNCGTPGGPIVPGTPPPPPGTPGEPTPCTGAGCQITTDASGWSVFTQPAGAQKIYVSTSGSDSNDGKTITTPVKSLGKARDLIRSGSADWMLLKKGDTWNEPIGTWSKSGSSANQRIVISSYGTGARPRVMPAGDVSGITISGASNLAIIDIQLSNKRTGSGNGTGGVEISASGEVNNLLIEGVKIEGFEHGIVTQGNDSLATVNSPLRQNIVLRRSVITGNYSSSQAQGIYLTRTRGVRIEENVFYHNGWLESGVLPSDLGAPSSSAPHPNGQSQNIYLQYDVSGVEIRNNIIASGAWSGIQARQGGIIDGNLVTRNNHGILAGLNNTQITNNIVFEPENHTRGKQTTGIETVPSNSVTVRGNIIANSLDDEFGQAIRIASVTTYKGAKPGEDAKIVSAFVRDYTGLIENNTIYNSGTAFSVANGGAVDSMTVKGNVFDSGNARPCFTQSQGTTRGGIGYQSNLMSCAEAGNGKYTVSGATKTFTEWKAFAADSGSVEQAVSVVNSNATIGTYHASKGGANSYEAFMAQATQQSKDNWRTAYTAQEVNKYLSAAFKKK